MSDNNTKQPHAQEHLTAKEVQAIAGGISRGTLRRWVDRGHLPPPAVKVGLRFQRWLKGDLDAWRQRVGSQGRSRAGDDDEDPALSPWPWCIATCMEEVFFQRLADAALAKFAQQQVVVQAQHEAESVTVVDVGIKAGP